MVPGTFQSGLTHIVSHKPSDVVSELMQSAYHSQQVVYMVTMLFWRPGLLNSTVVYPSVQVVIIARKCPTCLIVHFNLTLGSKNRTKRMYPCTLDLSGPDINNEELEAVPEASSLQMVPLLSVAGIWWIPLLASIYFHFPHCMQ